MLVTGNAFPVSFFPGEQFFETLGLTPIEGSPSAAQLSADCPEDGAVVTHSMALTLFGTDQVIGRRIVEMDYSDEALQDGNGPKVLSRYAIAGVVEDFRLHPHERHAFSIIIPSRVVGDYAPKLLVRLRPEADPVAFINRLTLPGDIKAGNQSLAYFETYTDFRNDQNYNRDTVIFSIMGTFIALLLLNVVLGTLGTFWLQIRKRTEDIGIMRSFGAKRRHIFGMLWREAALLTLIACVFGQSIWFQFAMNVGLAEGYSRSGTGQDADWVSTFWQHFLIVSAVQYVLLLAIVTLGILVPTLIAMYKRPVEALRHE